MSTDDETLLRAFLRHRTELSFRRLYRCHTPALFAMAMRLAGASVAAEELTQDAWCRAVENIDRFDNKSRFRTWLIGILINCYREDVRRDAKTRQATDAELADLGGASVTPLHRHDSKQADILDVERALVELPPGYKEVVLLHDLAGNTHREIAAMLNISEGTSKSQLQRGRARLRALLMNPSASNTD